jgi:diguanylate cyclase (GGDEF)-like protein
VRIDPRTPVAAAGAPRGPKAAAASAGGSAVAAPQDVISILGVPEVELTPRVRQALGMLMAEVDTLRRERDRLREQLKAQEALADTDPLVETMNRRAFVRELARIVSFADRYDVHASLIFFDLDGFKAINDGYGHAAGDATLRHVAAYLKTHTRDSDVVGRVGGDEFAVILAQASGAQAQIKAASLAAGLAETPFLLEGVEHRIQASVGVYTFEKGDTPERVLARADEAMYAAKGARRRD